MGVVGGLLTSQLITLYLTPVVYIYLDAFQRKLTGVRLSAKTRNPELIASK